MRIDYLFMRETILLPILQSEKPAVSMHELFEALEGDSYKEAKLFFNWQALCDARFVRTASNTEAHRCLQYRERSGEVLCQGAAHVMLTFKGNEFAVALSQDAIWEKVKDKLAEAPLGVASAITIKLLAKSLENGIS